MRTLMLVLDQAITRCRSLAQNANVIRVWDKTLSDGRKEVVSELDHAIERLLVGAMREQYPEAAIVAEETLGDLTLLDRDLCFVIDPLDGTKEFLSGRDGFCISVALLKRRRPVLAVLDFPARRQRFWAQLGRGATLNGRPIQVSRTGRDREIQVGVSRRQAADPRFQAVRRNAHGMVLRPVGALACKVAGVASGLYDAAFFLDWQGNQASVWDMAAAGLILQEAGGRFTALDGSDLLAIMPGVNRRGWLATNGCCHERLLTLLSRLPGDNATNQPSEDGRRAVARQPVGPPARGDTLRSQIKSADL